MHSTISEKGQITVPKPLRDRLGLRPGDRLELAEEQGHIVLSKASTQDPVSAVYGILSLGEGTDDALRALRRGLVTVPSRQRGARRARVKARGSVSDLVAEQRR